MFLTRKEISERLLYFAEYYDTGSVEDDLRALAEEIWPTCTEDGDEDAAREAVRETQYIHQ